MAPTQCRLHELGLDILGEILTLLDQQSRKSAGTACKALREASCLPGVWDDLNLDLDLADQDMVDRVSHFLGRRGAGLRSFRFITTCSAASLLLPRRRLASLLGRVPALQELCLDSHDLVAVRLPDLAANLPRLEVLDLAERWQGGDERVAKRPPHPLLVGQLAGLQNFSCLQCLQLKLDWYRVREVSVGPMLRAIEALTTLTALFFMTANEPDYPLFPEQGAWSPHVSRLQLLHEYADHLGLRLPLAFGRLHLGVLELDNFDWQHGGALCTLRGLTCLEGHSFYPDDEGGGGTPDLTGLQKTLSTVEEPSWSGWIPGLVEQFRLECLVTLNLDLDSDLFACLTWSPTCRLENLCLHDNYYEDGVVDLTVLSPLTTLTSLEVRVRTLSSLPKAPCVAYLQEVKLSRTALVDSHIPGELQGAERLQRLALSNQPNLVVSRECAAVLAGLRGLTQVKLRKCPKWDLKRGEWDEQSAERLNQICCKVEADPTDDSDADSYAEFGDDDLHAV